MTKNTPENRGVFAVGVLSCISMKKRYFAIFSILALIIGWSILLAQYSPQAIIEWLGVSNAYLVAFLVATFGGVSTITATSYYATVATLAAGGINPFLLAIIAGIGITIGDGIFYYLGTRGYEVLSGKPKHWAQKAHAWIDNRPDWALPVLVYAYTGLTPLPNDVFMIALGLSRFKFNRILLALILGNITLTFIVALAGAYGVEWVYTFLT